MPGEQQTPENANPQQGGAEQQGTEPAKPAVTPMTSAADPAPSASEPEQVKDTNGRPTIFTEDLGDQICDRISDGRSLRSVCLDDDMPGKSTVFRWLRTHTDFRDQYARACEDRADAMAEDLLDIADDGTNDYMTVKRGDNEIEVPNPEVLQRSRLRVDARKFLMSKMKPKKYGDHLKIDQDSTVTHKFKELDDDELDARLEETISTAKD